MALDQYRTLPEMVSEVLIRCALGQMGELNSDLHPQIKGYLRQAQRELWTKCRWLRLRTRQSITAIEDQTQYDIPDGFEPGSIDRVIAKDDDGREWPLIPGISPEDRTDAALTSAETGDEPSRWTVTDGILEVLDAPAADIAELIVEGWLAPGRLEAEEDRPSVDDEACIRYAVIELKKQKKMLTTAEARAERADLFEGYVADLDAGEAISSPMSLGTGYVDPMDKPPTSRRSRPWWQANRRP